jgi:hypothetical protein
MEMDIHSQPRRQKSRRPLLIALLVLILFIASCTGYKLYIGSDENPDLDQNNEETIEEIEEGLEGSAALIDELEEMIAAQEAGEEIDEEVLNDLVAQIMEETEDEIAALASEIAEIEENASGESVESDADTESENPGEETVLSPEEETAIQETLAEIDEIQNDLLATLEDTLEVVEDKEVTEIIEEAIEQVQEGMAEDALREEAEGDPDQPETVPGEATQEEQPEDAPGEPVQTEQPEIEPGDGIPTQNEASTSIPVPTNTPTTSQKNK